MTVRLNGTATVTPSASSVGSSQITDGAIASADIADSAVTTAKIAAQAVTLAKIDRTGATTGKVLTGNGAGADPSWETPSSSPTTTRGDLIVRGASADVRLAVGSSGQVLGSNGTDPAWITPPASSPTTTRGDLIRRGASADERLAIGTSGQVLTSNGTDAAWATPDAPVVKAVVVTIAANTTYNVTVPVTGWVLGYRGSVTTTDGGSWTLKGPTASDVSVIMPSGKGPVVGSYGGAGLAATVTAGQTCTIVVTGGRGVAVVEFVAS